jgi:hypothetical protein
MKPSSKRESSRSWRHAAAFTIPEFMITLTVTLLFMAALIACHLLGLRMFEMTKAKLGASADARRSINLMVSELRSSKIVKVGFGDAVGFRVVTPDTPFRGSALQIHSSTNTNTWVRYFWDASDQKLKRATNGMEKGTVIASGISNEMVFSLEDYTGTVLTNNEQEFVIGLNLQFYQLQYPFVKIGPGNFYDYYQLQTRVTPRAP